VRSVGIVANPAAGKDVRRLVAHASTFDNLEKVNIVRRVLRGLSAAAVDDVLYMQDAFGIVARALHHLDGAPPTRAVNFELTDTDADSTCAATILRESGVRCIVTLGGDGTNRAVAKGCGEVPLLPVSTGTNNVFPQVIEGTIAGLAAGAIASGVVDLSTATHATLRLDVLRDGRLIEVALVDAAVCADRFVGSRAVWDPTTVRAVVSTAARSDVIGLSSIGGFLPGVQPAPGEGLVVEIGRDGESIVAPLAPGLVRAIRVSGHRRLKVGDVVELGAAGEGVLALDGERILPIHPGDRFQVLLSDRGPRVVDVSRALCQAVARGLFAGSGPPQLVA
jgi:predicted polyphosphate/ATP-dependent NAD kinase